MNFYTILDFLRTNHYLAAITLFATIYSIVGCSESSIDPSSKSVSGNVALIGNLEYVFETKSVQGPIALELKHSFELRNESSDIVRIEKVVTSCGCTSATPDDSEIEPGEVVNIDVVLHLASPGRKTESAWLILDNGERVELKITGEARQMDELYSSSRKIHGASPSLSHVIVTSVSSSDDQPPAPVMKLPEGIIAEVGEWQQIYSLEIESCRRVRWHCDITITIPPDLDTSVFSSKTISIGIGDESLPLYFDGWGHERYEPEHLPGE